MLASTAVFSMAAEAATISGSLVVTMEQSAISLQEVSPSTLTLTPKTGVTLQTGDIISSSSFATDFTQDPQTAVAPGCMLVTGNAGSSITITNSNSLTQYNTGSGGLIFNTTDVKISVSATDCATAEAGVFNSLAAGATTSGIPLNSATGKLYIAWKRDDFSAFKWQVGNIYADTTLDIVYQ